MCIPLLPLAWLSRLFIPSACLVLQRWSTAWTTSWGRGAWRTATCLCSPPTRPTGPTVTSLSSFSSTSSQACKMRVPCSSTLQAHYSFVASVARFSHSSPWWRVWGNPFWGDGVGWGGWRSPPSSGVWWDRALPVQPFNCRHWCFCWFLVSGCLCDCRFCLLHNPLFVSVLLQSMLGHRPADSVGLCWVSCCCWMFSVCVRVCVSCASIAQSQLTWALSLQCKGSKFILKLSSIAVVLKHLAEAIFVCWQSV